MLISRSCSWVSIQRGGCKFVDSKTRGCPLSKGGWVGCSFPVGTQGRRRGGVGGVSRPPPFWEAHFIHFLYKVLGKRSVQKEPFWKIAFKQPPPPGKIPSYAPDTQPGSNLKESVPPPPGTVTHSGVRAASSRVCVLFTCPPYGTRTYTQTMEEPRPGNV